MPTGEDEQHGEQDEGTATGPTGAEHQAQQDQGDGEQHAQGRHADADDAQQSQGRGGHAGDQVEHQVDQAHRAVLGIAVFTLGVGHEDFRGVAGKTVGQDRNEGAAFTAGEHGVDDGASVGA